MAGDAPDWYLNLEEGHVAEEGRSQALALSNGVALLSTRKKVSVSARTELNESSLEIDQVLQEFRSRYENDIVTESRADLTEKDYIVTRQAEIDGTHFVELRLL